MFFSGRRYLAVAHSTTAASVFLLSSSCGAGICSSSSPLVVRTSSALSSSSSSSPVLSIGPLCQHPHRPCLSPLLFSRVNSRCFSGSTAASKTEPFTSSAAASFVPVQFSCRRLVQDDNSRQSSPDDDGSGGAAAAPSPSSSSSSPSSPSLRQQQHIAKLEQAICEQLFSDKRDETLYKKDEDRKHYETFLKTVDAIGQNLPAEQRETPNTSSSSSSSSSSKQEHKKQQQQQSQHLRIISLELAKWIDNNPSSTGLEFKDFYQYDLPEALGIKTRNQKFSVVWMVFEEKKFRAYLSNTVLNVINNALCCVKKPLTIADIAASSCFKRVHDHFTCIDESLGQNVISQVLVADDVAKRNVKCPLLFPSKGAKSKVKLQQDRVTIISGASGAGKTITSLAVATLRNRLAKGNDIIIYTQLSHAFAVKKLKCGASIEGAMKKLKYGGARKARNEAVFDWVLNTFDNIINTGNSYLVPDDREDYNVVFIIDEIGCNPEFLPGLCSMLPKLATTLHNKMFTRQLTTTDGRWRKSRVRFIAAGTGASFATAPAASNPNRYRTYFVDSQPADTFYVDQLEALQNSLQRNINKALKKKKKRSLREPEYPLTRSDLNEIFNMLRRIDRREQENIVNYNTNLFVDTLQHEKEQQYQKPWITATEKAAADLVRNARCAALLIRKAIVQSFQFDSSKDNEESAYVDALTGTVDATSIPWWKSVAKFNERLRAWLPEVMNTYIAMNGLSLTADPVNIIKYAIATSLFRLPCLPDEFRSGLSPSSPALPEYTNTLIAKGGVLVDLATASAAQEETLIRLNEFISPKKLQKPRQSKRAGEANVVWALKKATTTTRFFTSPAHVVMFRSACGLSFDRSPEFSYSLEYDTADFCAMTLICASAYHQMRRQIIELYPNGEGLSKLDEFDQEYNYKYDSLFGLKKKLAHEYCGIDGHGIRGAKILHLVDSPLRSINKYATTTDETEQKELENVARAKTNLLCADLEASLERGEAVVIISKEMEQFADVIVVSPGRVMLIQCKQKLQPKKSYNYTYIYWMDEIEKMCGFEEKADDFTEVGRKDKMRRIYLDGLKKAAAVNGQPAEVELVFLVEGEEETCNWCRDDLQSRTNNIKRDEHSAMIKQGSIIKKWKNTIISEGIDVMPWKGEKDNEKKKKKNEKTTLFPVSFFAVHRLTRADSRWKSYPPPFFPIPHHTEGLHVDRGINFVTGEYVAPKTSLELAKFVEKEN